VNENEKVLVAHKLRDPNAKTELTTYDMTSGSSSKRRVRMTTGEWATGQVVGW